MDCQITKEILYTLTLTESEAMWLKILLQNPINTTHALESLHSSNLRTQLFNLLNNLSESKVLEGKISKDFLGD